MQPHPFLTIETVLYLNFIEPSGRGHTFGMPCRPKKLRKDAKRKVRAKLLT